MLTQEQVESLQKGDIVVYNNNGRKTEWVVDYPKSLLNPKQKITVFEGQEAPNPKRVALETPAGGGECIGQLGCLRVSIATPNGRGKARFSMLISDFTNWELPEGSNETPETPETPSEPEITTSPVTLSELSPLPDSTITGLGNNFINITLTFSDQVKLGESGNFLLTWSNGQVQLDRNNDVTFNNNVVTLVPQQVLENNTEYQVVIESGAILDANDKIVNVFGSNVYKFNIGE